MKLTSKPLIALSTFAAALVVISTLGLQLSTCFAADLVWTNTAGGDWAVAANWNPNQVPTAADNAWITNIGTYTVNVATDSALGTLTLGGASRTLAGTTLGGEGKLTLTGVLNWTTRGTIYNTVQFNGGSFSNGYKLLYGKLINSGTVALNGADIYALGGSVVSNLAGGTFDLTGSTSLLPLPSGGVVYNAGLFRRSGGTGMSVVDVPFVNTGTISVQNGTLRLSGWSTHHGVLTVEFPGTLDFGGSQHRLEANSSVSGDGVVSCSAGTLHVYGGCTVAGTILIGAGTINFYAAANAGAVTLNGNGTLGGSGLLDCGVFNWSNGTIAGGVQCNGGPISGINTKFLTRGRLINAGLLTLSGGSIFTASGAVITNLAGATLNLDDHPGFTHNSGAQGTIHNAGLFRKSGAGTTLIGEPFHNTGTVEARSGKLQFTQPFIQLAGLTRLWEGKLQANYGFTWNGGELVGTNIFTGNLTNSATVSPGASPGLLTIVGDYTETPTGHLQTEIGGTTPGTDFDQISVSGVAELGGVLNVSLVNGFRPAPGDGFPVLLCASRVGTFAQINGLNLGQGLVLVPEYRTNGLVLRAEVQASSIPLSVELTLTNTAIVSWSLPASGWVLQQAPLLTGNPLLWTEISPPYQTNSTQAWIAVPVPEGNQFFRLHRP